MTNLQNIIIILWFVPVVGFIVLPLFWTLLATLYSAVERSRLTGINGYVEVGLPESEKRHRNRLFVEEARAYFDEKSDCGTAAVSNISMDGICLKNITSNLDPEADQLRIVFRTQHRDYDFTAKPIWKRMTDKGYEIGAKIGQVPSGWKNLIERASHSHAVVPA